MNMSDTVVWTAPDENFWELELVHFPRPVPRAFRDVFAAAASEGLAESCERYGVPLNSFFFSFVNDRMYQRLEPVMDPDEMARRAATASDVFEERRWRADVRRWREITKPARIDANLRRQRVDLAALNDSELDAELTAALDNLRAGTLEHMRLVFAVDVCLGDFLARADEWGLDTKELLGLLAGASPASGEATRMIADGDIAGFRELHGWRSPAYDPSVPTLGEHERALDQAITAAKRRPPHAKDSPATAGGLAALRARVPAVARDEFDDLLSEATSVYGVRDENESPTLLWPVGLLRRVLLEIAARLVARGLLEERDDVFFAERDEIGALLHRQGGAPQADELAERRRHAWLLSADAPLSLGTDPGPPPPLDVFPEGMRSVARAAMTTGALEYATMGGVGDDGVLTGIGIGEQRYRGRACVASSPADALDRLEEGDVLVITSTNSALDPILALAGALVVEEGGPWTHAAIVARELGLPAVVGARGALSAVHEGDVVEVDGVTGTVRRLT